MKTGLYISGTAHAGLIAWILFGGLFLRADDAPTLENTQVSILSAEEFAALSPPELLPVIGAEVSSPEAPMPDVPVAPVQPEETTDLPDEPTPQEAPEQPEPPIAPTQPSEAVVVDQSPSALETPEPQVVPLAPIAPIASPRPSTRVAPEPVVTETPDLANDIIAQEATESIDEPVQEPAPEVDQTTAPEEASDRIVAEADAPPASAPVISRRPPSRPSRPKPAEPSSSQSDDILAALNEANEAPAQRSVPSGPPLSAGEKDALRLSVSQCWNVGTLSSEALRTTVVVGLNMGRDSKPDNGSLHLISSNGGSQASANQAYEAARRAIIRCGAQGFDLPPEKYDHWKEIEITFDPEKMRNR